MSWLKLILKSDERGTCCRYRRLSRVITRPWWRFDLFGRCFFCEALQLNCCETLAVIALRLMRPLLLLWNFATSVVNLLRWLRYDFNIRPLLLLRNFATSVVKLLRWLSYDIRRRFCCETLQRLLWNFLRWSRHDFRPTTVAFAAKLCNFCCETFAVIALRHTLTQPELTTRLLDVVCTCCLFVFYSIPPLKVKYFTFCLFVVYPIHRKDTLERFYLTRYLKHTNGQRLWRLLSD